MPAAEHETENKLSTQDLTLLNPLLAVGDLSIPEESNPWGAANATAAASRLGKPAGGRRSAAAGRKSVAARRLEEGGERTPAARWLAGDQLGSSDLLFTLQEELEAVENIGVSPSLAREPCCRGCIRLAPADRRWCPC